MDNVVSILKRAANKSGFERTRFKDSDVPESMTSISILPFFGDTRSMAILSSLLLHRYKEDKKYFILCSWPGFEGLFPYVDEYWSIKDNLVERMSSFSNGMTNSSRTAIALERSLNYFFEDVVNASELFEYYNNGITEKFFDSFGDVVCFKPVLNSLTVLGRQFVKEFSKREGNKVFLFPTKLVYGWEKNKAQRYNVGIEFWTALVEFLLKEGYMPVILQNQVTTYDLSTRFAEKCLYVTDRNIINIMSVMHSCGCVLDIFNGISSLSLLARTPYVCCDERKRFNGTKEFEINCLCGKKIPREYIFSFANLITIGYDDVWKNSLFNNIKKKLNDIFSDVDVEKLPSTSESYDIVSYDEVKKAKAKKMGVRFLKLPQ
jgi:hypothetical protein